MDRHAAIQRASVLRDGHQTIHLNEAGEEVVERFDSFSAARRRVRELLKKRGGGMCVARKPRESSFLQIWRDYHRLLAEQKAAREADEKAAREAAVQKVVEKV